jgi:hypothetical protein
MRSWTIFAASLALTAGAALAQNKGGGGIPSPLKITVSGYSDGGDIPEKFTCAVKPAGGSPLERSQAARPAETEACTATAG